MTLYISHQIFNEIENQPDVVLIESSLNSGSFLQSIFFGCSSHKSEINTVIFISLGLEQVDGHATKILTAF